MERENVIIVTDQKTIESVIENAVKSIHPSIPVLAQ